MIDRYLRKRKGLYKWSKTNKSLITQIGLLLLFKAILIVSEFIANWQEYMAF